MTKEQTEACEKLELHYPGCDDPQYERGFKNGFQAAQTPGMLLLNPVVKGLVEALDEAHFLTCDETQIDKTCFICEALATFKRRSDGSI